MTLQFPLKARTAIAALAFAAVVMPLPAAADAFVFSTGNPDGLMATATRPESAGKFEIETGDDFVLTQHTSITGVSFTGLIPKGASPSIITNVVLEIYRVFPADSNVGRTSGPPTFSTPNVPTRVNSPSDVAFRQFSRGRSLAAIVLQPSFTAPNSVQPGGIHPLPNVFTNGNGPVTGEEIKITVNSYHAVRFACGSLLLRPASRIIEWGLSLALRTEADRSAGNGLPARLHRSSELDTRRQ